jgi:hypothetical protein
MLVKRAVIFGEYPIKESDQPHAAEKAAAFTQTAAQGRVHLIESQAGGRAKMNFLPEHIDEKNGNRRSAYDAQCRVHEIVTRRPRTPHGCCAP